MILFSSIQVRITVCHQMLFNGFLKSHIKQNFFLSRNISASKHQNKKMYSDWGFFGCRMHFKLHPGGGRSAKNLCPYPDYTNLLWGVGKLILKFWCSGAGKLRSYDLIKGIFNRTDFYNLVTILSKLKWLLPCNCDTCWKFS